MLAIFKLLVSSQPYAVDLHFMRPWGSLFKKNLVALSSDRADSIGDFKNTGPLDIALFERNQGLIGLRKLKLLNFRHNADFSGEG